MNQPTPRMPCRGDIVEFVLFEKSNCGDSIRPAIITSTDGLYVNLTVFYDDEGLGGSQISYRRGVAFGQTKKTGTWHWRGHEPVQPCDCCDPVAPTIINSFDSFDTHDLLRLNFYRNPRTPTCYGKCECCRESEIKSILKSVEEDLRIRFARGDKYVGMGPLAK